MFGDSSTQSAVERVRTDLHGASGQLVVLGFAAATATAAVVVGLVGLPWAWALVLLVAAPWRIRRAHGTYLERTDAGLTDVLNTRRERTLEWTSVTGFRAEEHMPPKEFQSLVRDNAWPSWVVVAKLNSGDDAVLWSTGHGNYGHGRDDTFRNARELAVQQAEALNERRRTQTQDT